MVWTEARSGVKFLCWGKKKDNLEEEQAFVVPMGKSIEAVVKQVEIVKNDDGEIENYKYRLEIKGVDEPVIMWSNASIKRQQEELGIEVDEKILVTYVKDYKTKNKAKPGREIKLMVDRPVEDNNKKKKK